MNTSELWDILQDVLYHRVGSVVCCYKIKNLLPYNKEFKRSVTNGMYFHGMVNGELNVIYIEETLPLIHQCAVMIHEFGHAFDLFRKRNPKWDTPYGDERIADVLGYQLLLGASKNIPNLLFNYYMKTFIYKR